MADSGGNESVLIFLQRCVETIDFEFVGYGLVGSLVVHFALCMVTTPYYASHTLLLAGTVALMYMGTLAFNSQPFPSEVSLLASPSQDAHTLAHVMIVYQLFNVVVTAQVKELQKVSWRRGVLTIDSSNQ